MKIATIIFAACLLACSALAQDTDMPAGELPVDPYEMSNDNAGATPLADDALFRAFGAEAGISRIVDEMVELCLADPRIRDVFMGSDLVRLRRTLKEQFCYILGGPCDYTGRDMASSHADHRITTAEFNALVENLQIAMSKEGVAFRHQNRLLAKLAPMHRDIVRR
ncbi:group I truncated hemoglobin [Hyphomonas sp.]|uniref:group I truncated hemoglobin n=1 Tax=Hyphomonas sp. TaxID=87 RepID=UPI00391C1CED